MPRMLLPDIPTYYTSFTPHNYNEKFDGAVPAGEALSRSLNIPAVRLLEDYGIDRLINLLNKLNINTIDKSADHYGLSLILGGGEATLWNLSGAYSSMARVLNEYTANNSTYSEQSIKQPDLFLTKEKNKPTTRTVETSILNAGAIYQTLNALTGSKRPEEEAGWELFASSRKIAWKTGTSYGFRDAWCIGVTPDYTVAVWVGNASGEGRPGIVGGLAAAPVMFKLFDLLPSSGWFEVPYDDMQKVAVCKSSGYMAGADCSEADSLFVPLTVKPLPMCPYHELIHLTSDKQHRVNSTCYPVNQMVHVKWFVLPPVMEWYYKRRHPWYKSLPTFLSGCNNDQSLPIQMIYPKNGAAVIIPVGLNGKLQKLVLKATHRQAESKLYWHLNDRYIGTTHHIHEMEILPEEGAQTITLSDENGNMLTQVFSCSRDK